MRVSKVQPCALFPQSCVQVQESAKLAASRSLVGVGGSDSESDVGRTERAQVGDEACLAENVGARMGREDDVEGLACAPEVALRVGRSRKRLERVSEREVARMGAGARD